jgi:HTH-type transcriptional regulator, sugar sensing transcriptional regulator
VVVTEARVRRLRDYDLTEYQARVYLALLDLGAAAASAVGSLARVPRTRIYATMQQLHAKGLVKLLPERPLRYRAVPITSYIQGLAQEYRGRASELIAESEGLARDFPITSSRSPDAKGRFEAIYGRRNVRDRIHSMYQDAQTTIITVGSAKSPGRIRHAFGGLLQGKAKDGLSIKMAFYVSPENLADVRALGKFAEVRGIDFFTPVFRHGVDNREFLMGHPVPDDDSTIRGDDIAIWTDDGEIATAMAQMAERIWEIARPLDSRSWRAPRRLRVMPDES